MAKKFYAVQRGRTPGVYVSWADCEKQVKGFSGAVYKSFPTMAEAEEFIKSGSVSLSLADYFAGPSEHDDNEIKPTVAPRGGASQGFSLADVGVMRNASGASSSRGAAGIGTRVSVSSGASSRGAATAGTTGADTAYAYIDGSFDKHIGAVGSGGVIFYNGATEEFSFGTKDPFYTAYWNVSGELLAAMHTVNYAVENGIKELTLYYDYMGIEMWATGRWKTNNPLTQHYAQFMKGKRALVAVHFSKVAAHTGVTYNERADVLAKEGVRKA